MKANDLTKRLFDFAVSVINFLKTLPDSPKVKIIKFQLIKSTPSSGAKKVTILLACYFYFYQTI